MMIVEEVFAALLLIIHQGMDYLLLHVCRDDGFVLSITLDIVTVIFLKLRVL